MNLAGDPFSHNLFNMESHVMHSFYPGHPIMLSKVYSGVQIYLFIPFEANAKSKLLVQENLCYMFWIMVFSDFLRISGFPFRSLSV